MKRNVIIFLALYLLSFTAIHFTVAHLTKKESQNVLVALIKQKKFQGLTLDDVNFCSLATTMLESNETLYVQKARFLFLLTGKSQELVFADGGNLFNSFHLVLKHDNHEIEMTIVNVYWSLLKQLSLSFILSSFFMMFLFLLRWRNEKEKYQIITQIAHDIRSPVVALEHLLSDIKNITNEDEKIIKKSLNRINNMASDLLAKNKRSTTSKNKNLRIEFLPALIEEIVAEKRAQYAERNDILIDFNLNSNSSELFSKVKVFELSRVISNIINNSVEAINNKGHIVISLEEEGDNILIKVTDNGKGIAPDVLSKICQKGQTFGKKEGLGLGLFHARSAIESWSGSLSITSTLSQGTEVRILLPKESRPSWFVSTLELDQVKTIVVLDDDLSIHHSWKKLFDRHPEIKNRNIEIFSFSTPHDLNKWLNANTVLKEKTLFLIDYELFPFNETGLELILKHDIQRQSILVTSRFNENNVFNEAIKNEIRLIPKMVLTKTQISFFTTPDTSTFEYVYLEDEAVHRRAWEKLAKKNGKNLLTISEAEDFFKYEENLSKETTTIYIDSHLGEGKLRGEELAVILRNQGYKHIFLSTGYEKEKFEYLPWLKVVSKKCPWR